MSGNNIALALRSAYLALHRRSDARFARLGVTADQFVLLAALARGAALTQRDLSKRVSSDPSTVRAMLVLLERQGLIKREPHSSDSRARSVSLTPKGKRKFRQLWAAGEPIRQKMLDTLTSGEAEQLTNLLTRAAAALGGVAALPTSSLAQSVKEPLPPFDCPFPTPEMTSLPKDLKPFEYKDVGDQVPNHNAT